MPWYNGDYPPSYKNQPLLVREKAVEIANALLLDGAEEGIAIATGLKQARMLLKNNNEEQAFKPSDMQNNQDKNNDDSNQGANSAYSGSGSLQPGGNPGETGKMSGSADENLEDVQQQSENIPDNSTESSAGESEDTVKSSKK